MTQKAMADGPRLSRRSLLAGSAAVPLLVACTDSTAPGTPPEDADAALAASVIWACQDAARFLAALAERHPSIAAELTAAVEVHEAHVAVLHGGVPDAALPTQAPLPRVPARTDRALAAAAEAEDALALEIRQAAFRATSGPFARVLAGFAAAAAQQAAVLAGAS